MSELELLKWGAYVLVGITGWFVRVLWEGQKEMRKDLREIEKNLAENYMKKPDIKEMVSELKLDMREVLQPLVKKLERLEDHLIISKKDDQ